MAHVKLRPLVIHESASNQAPGNDPCTPDPASRGPGSGLPVTARGKPLSPAPPETGSNSPAADDNGVSKLRSKLRRLLGAHGSGQSHSSSKVAAVAAGSSAAFRSASSASIQERPSSTASSSRAPASVPVSPHVASAARGRFSSASNVLSPSASPTAATPPTTPPGPGASALGGHRTGPIPSASAASPSAAASASSGVAHTNPVRTPSAKNGSSAKSAPLRRAVSFNPMTTTFPPLITPSPPPMPPASPCSTPGNASSATPGGSARGSISPGNSVLTLAARLSSMVVVPENETLGIDVARAEREIVRADFGLPGCAVAVRGSPSADIRHGKNSTDCSEVGIAPHLDGTICVTSPPMTLLTSNGGRLTPTQLPQSAPFAPLADVRRVSSSSSSSITYACSNNGYGASAAAHGDASAYVTTMPSSHLASWTSDASSGPFNAVAVAAATAMLETPTAAPPQLRGASFRSATAAPSTRRPSSPTIAASSPRAAHSNSLSSHVPALSSHPSTPQAATPAALHPSPLSAQQAGVPPIARGMSAFILMPSAGGRSSVGATPGVSTSGPWATMPSMSSAAAVAANASGAGMAANGDSMTPDIILATAPSQQIAAAAASGENRATSPTSKQAPIRRAFSTLDSAVKTEAPTSPPGVVMALGASLPSEMKRKEWRMEDFTMLKKLYKGNYSSVHKALCRFSMRLVVIKVYDTTRMTELARNHVRREAALHAPLEHDNILNLYAVFSQGPYVMLVEEVAEGGDLYHVLKGVPGHRLQEDRAVAGVLVPLLRALSYLHEQGICHRDIKLENILFSDRQHTRMLLADFGIALSLRQERAVTRAGTTEYMSPEQLRCPFKRHPSDNKERTDLHYGLGVDVWATGVLTYELLHGYPPFLGSNREETEQLILAGDVQVAPQLSSGARDFVLSCLQKDPVDRPTVMQLLQHTWIRQNMRQLRIG